MNGNRCPESEPEISKKRGTPPQYVSSPGRVARNKQGRSRNRNGDENGHDDERDDKGEGSRPYDDFPVGPCHDWAKDFGQGARERWDTQDSSPSNPPILFDRFPFKFLVQSCMAGVGERQGCGGRSLEAVGSSILGRLSGNGEVPVSRFQSISIYASASISTSVSSRRFTCAPTQDVPYNLLRGSTFSLCSPDEQPWNLHQPSPQYAILSACFGQACLVVKGGRGRSVAGAVPWSPLEDGSPCRGRRGLEGR